MTHNSRSELHRFAVRNVSPEGQWTRHHHNTRMNICHGDGRLRLASRTKAEPKEKRGSNPVGVTRWVTHKCSELNKKPKLRLRGQHMLASIIWARQTRQTVAYESC